MADPILRRRVGGRLVDDVALEDLGDGPAVELAESVDPGDEHEHRTIDDCTTCTECGHCHESCDEDGICAYCRGP